MKAKNNSLYGYHELHGYGNVSCKGKRTVWFKQGTRKIKKIIIKNK